ncbi:RING-H2 finger protein ATL13 [Platanthera zijinensis]|uniref:RING-type E3 ubiquitin transferase n=1 Tax=Platanthera zijinensis TaxID=2320716 RepID=A0AAP0FWF7_9ASPA
MLTVRLPPRVLTDPDSRILMVKHSSGLSRVTLLAAYSKIKFTGWKSNNTNNICLQLLLPSHPSSIAINSLITLCSSAPITESITNPPTSASSSSSSSSGPLALFSPVFMLLHAHLIMDWVSMNSSKQVTFSLPSPPPPPPVPAAKYEGKISPSILLIIVILAVIFFISGIIHLLVRFLLRTTAREPEEADNATALQGQLQELFHLHDAGVDQSFIDTLPIFIYRAIIGLKDPFDCAVCLCEFDPEDKLRLLPKCSHAFHIDCIDAWLLSHSTCPLCRRSLFPDFSPAHPCNPIVLVLESGNESSRELILSSNREDPALNSQRSESHRDCYDTAAAATPVSEYSWRGKTAEVKQEELSSGSFNRDLPHEKVVSVKLGKFQNVDVGGGAAGEGQGSCSRANAGSEESRRRCFSMGSYEYVMDEKCMLQVPIHSVAKQKKIGGVKKPGSRATVSECGFNPAREGISDDRVINGSTTSASTLQKRESFSVSKIWLQPRKEKAAEEHDSSRRAFSFSLPLHRLPVEELKKKQLDSGEDWEKSGSEVDLDVEVGSCVNSLGSQIEETPSFARRTLLWIVGKQSKVSSNPY